MVHILLITELILLDPGLCFVDWCFGIANMLRFSLLYHSSNSRLWNYIQKVADYTPSWTGTLLYTVLFVQKDSIVMYVVVHTLYRTVHCIASSTRCL